MNKMNASCMYCQKDERVDNLMIEIARLRISTLYLFKEQTYPGRVIVAANDHYDELFRMPEPQREEFIRDVCQAAEAVQKAFSPDKVNYGAFGDTMPHLHFHIVPKFRDGYTWGKMFEMNPAPNKHVSQAELAEVIEKLKAHL